MVRIDSSNAAGQPISCLWEFHLDYAKPPATPYIWRIEEAYEQDRKDREREVQKEFDATLERIRANLR